MVEISSQLLSASSHPVYTTLASGFHTTYLKYFVPFGIRITIYEWVSWSLGNCWVICMYRLGTWQCIFRTHIRCKTYLSPCQVYISYLCVFCFSSVQIVDLWPLSSGNQSYCVCLWLLDSILFLLKLFVFACKFFFQFWNICFVIVLC